MKNYIYKFIALLIFSFFSFETNCYSKGKQMCLDDEIFKVQLNLQIDTVKLGYFDFEKHSENYFKIYNESNYSLCFNEIPIFRDFKIQLNDNDINTVFYFPKIEYYNSMANSWEELNFFDLIGDSGEPLPLVGDNVICLEKGDEYVFQGLLWIKLIHFINKGKYRLSLQVYLKINTHPVISNYSNYHNFYVQ